MALTRRHWRTIITMDETGTTPEYVENIYYLRPSPDPDNPSFPMPEKQEALLQRYVDLTPTEQAAVDALVGVQVPAILARERPINTGT